MFYIKLIVFAVVLTTCMWYTADKASEHMQDFIQHSACGGELCATAKQAE